MKILKKYSIFLIIMLMIIAVGILTLSVSPTNISFAEDEITEMNVRAEFAYTRLNDTECSVRIMNKTEATIAIIPSSVKIDDVKYTVTEIAMNGFASCSKLQRITLPRSVKRIGNSAFSNCPLLEKVFLTNVETLGNNVFMRCPKLLDIVIPKSVNTVGAYLFRNSNTLVRIRAQEIGENWSSAWNTNNGNQNIEFGSEYEEPTIYEPIFNSVNTRSATPSEIIGYNVASGQANSEDFYETKEIVIPATYNELPIEGILYDSYSATSFGRLIFEYSDTPINIPSYAFYDVTGGNIIINRKVTFNDEIGGINGKSTNIFDSAKVKTIILPDSIPAIVDGMFYGCEILQNIYFITPKQDINLEDDYSQDDKVLVNISEATDVDSIGECAFAGTTSLKGIKIPNKITTVGATAFEQWTSNQEIHIDYVCDTQKFVDSMEEVGWQRDWIGISDAQILYSKYRITLDVNGGESIEPQYIDVDRDAPIGEIVTPTHRNGVFEGWFTERENGENVSSETIYTLRANATLYAHWKVEFLIELNPNGGEVEYDELKVVYNQSIINLPIPTKEDAVFRGWFTEQEGGTLYIDNVVFTGTENITLYAHWESEFKLIFDANGGNVSYTEKVVSYNRAIGSLPEPTKEDAVFQGWFTEKEGGIQYTNDMVFTRTEDITLYAHWNGKFKLIFDANGGNVSYTEIEVIYNSILVNLPEPTKEDAVFQGWFTEKEGGTQYANDMVFQETKDTILYAHWKSVFRITFFANGGKVSPLAQDVTYNQKVGSLPIPIRGEFSFMGWYDANDIRYTANTIFKEKNNITLTAKWAAIIQYYENESIKATQYVELTTSANFRSFSKVGYSGILMDLDIAQRAYKFNDMFTATKNMRLNIVWTERPLSYYQSGNDYTVYGPNQMRELRYGLNNGTITNVSNVYIGGNIDLTSEDWIPINNVYFNIIGNGYTIKYTNLNVTGSENYGFIKLLDGRACLENIKFQAVIKTSTSYTGKYLGVITAEINQSAVIKGCEVLSTVSSPYYNGPNNNNVDILVRNSTTKTGGLAGLVYGKGFEECINNCSIASFGSIGGIAGESHSCINTCVNKGNLYYDLKNAVDNEYRAVGGIAGFHEVNMQILFCTNAAAIEFAYISNAVGTNYSPLMGQIVGIEYSLSSSSGLFENSCSGQMVINKVNSAYTAHCSSGTTGYFYNKEKEESSGSGGGNCITAGSFITLADGRQIAVENLTGNEMLLVWNLYTGTFDVAPILFIDSDPAREYEIINLYFSDGTSVKVISEHAFWDCDLNKYVFLRADAAKYIGHWFNKQITNANGEMQWTKVQLVDVNLTIEVTTAWSPVTYGHLCYYVNGMLSMPGETESFINIFDVDAETMKIDEVAFARDVETYGLFTYEEFAEILPIPEVIFEAFGGQYLKVAIGKGLTTMEELATLIQIYEKFFN